MLPTQPDSGHGNKDKDIIQPTTFRPVDSNPFLPPSQTVDIVTYDATLGEDDEAGSAGQDAAPGVPLLFAAPFKDIRPPDSPNRLYEIPDFG